MTAFQSLIGSIASCSPTTVFEMHHINITHLTAIILKHLLNKKIIKYILQILTYAIVDVSLQ